MNVFGYNLNLDLHPSRWQRGFWLDRIDARSANVGLGFAILSVRPRYIKPM